MGRVAADSARARGAAPPLFGRDEVVRELRRLLDQIAEGHGQGLLLSGPAGIGKSQLLRSLVDRARKRGLTVLTGRSLPEELPTPFTLIRDLLGSVGPTGAVGRRAGPSADALPIFLAPFGDEPPGPGRTAEPSAPGDGSSALESLLAPLGSASSDARTEAREALFARLSAYLGELARSGPLVIALDDLAFADDSSLEFLRRFAGEIGDRPIGLVATVPPSDEVPPRTRAAVGALAAAPAVRTVAVRPMTVGEVGEFVRWILGGDEPDRDDVVRWHAQTEGNPLFVEQLVRASLGGGRAPDRPPDAPGRDVTEILVARTRSLPEGARRLLTYAAVLGKEFSFPKLSAVAGVGEERVGESLDRLVQEGLVREKGGEVYEFVADALRLHVYRELTETRRRLLHRKAGRALEAAGGASDSELARQFYLGRDDAKAVEYNERAAQSAARAFALETAVSHVARALEAQRRRPEADPRAELRLLTEEGRLLEEIGNLRRAEELLEEAVELARPRTGVDLELGRALLGLAQTRTDRADYTSAAVLGTEAIGLLGRVGGPRDLMDAHRVLGTVAWRVGNLAEAEHHRRDALAIAEVEGSPSEQGQTLVDLANTIVPLGSDRIEAALALYTRAADLFATGENQAARARVLMNRAVLEYGAERVDAALADLHLAIAAAEQSRSPIWISYCHLNLAQWNAELNRLGPARAALDRAIQAAMPLGDRLAAQQIAMTRGMIAEAEGAHELAEARYQDALAEARAIGMPAEAAEMLFRLAHLSHVRGDAATARQRLSESLGAGLREQRPDFDRRVAELERALGPG